MANYMVQTYGYVDNPLNIKKLVLDDLRSHNIFQHLRDTSKVGYELETYLHNTCPFGIAEYQDMIQSYIKAISKLKDKLDTLEVKGELLYQEYVDNTTKEFLEKKKSIKEGKDVPYYNNKIVKLRNRAFQLRKFIESYEGPKELYAEIISDVKDMIEALEEEASSYKEEAQKEIESRNKIMHSSSPELVSFQEWIEKEKSVVEDHIKFLNSRIEESKKYIDRLKSANKLIEELFYSLAPYDEDVL